MTEEKSISRSPQTTNATYNDNHGQDICQFHDQKICQWCNQCEQSCCYKCIENFHLKHERVSIVLKREEILRFLDNLTESSDYLKILIHQKKDKIDFINTERVKLLDRFTTEINERFKLLEGELRIIKHQYLAALTEKFHSDLIQQIQLRDFLLPFDTSYSTEKLYKIHCDNIKVIQDVSNQLTTFDCDFNLQPEIKRNMFSKSRFLSSVTAELHTILYPFMIRMPVKECFAITRANEHLYVAGKHFVFKYTMEGTLVNKANLDVRLINTMAQLNGKLYLTYDKMGKYSVNQGVLEIDSNDLNNKDLWKTRIPNVNVNCIAANVKSSFLIIGDLNNNLTVYTPDFDVVRRIRTDIGCYRIACSISGLVVISNGGNQLRIFSNGLAKIRSITIAAAKSAWGLEVDYLDNIIVCDCREKQIFVLSKNYSITKIFNCDHEATATAIIDFSRLLILTWYGSLYEIKYTE